MIFNGFDAGPEVPVPAVLDHRAAGERRRRLQARRPGDHGPGVVNRPPAARAPLRSDVVMVGRGEGPTGDRRVGGPGASDAAGRRSAATDVDLLRAHVAGDRDAFAELFRRHRDRLWAVALRTLGDREEAADALQDALLSAHRAAGPVPGRLGGHHLAAPDRGERLPGPDPPPAGPPDRAAAGRQPPTTTGRHRRRRSRPPRHRTTTPRWWSGRRSPSCRPSSGPRWSWSTCRATRWPRWPGSSASPRGRSRAAAPGAGPGSPCCSGTCAPAPTARRRPPRTCTGRHRPRTSASPGNRAAEGVGSAVGAVPAGRQPGGAVTAGRFSEVDHDLLADYVGGALDGTPEQVDRRPPGREDPAWARGVRRSWPRRWRAVRRRPGRLGRAARPPMPPDVADRLDRRARRRRAGCTTATAGRASASAGRRRPASRGGRPPAPGPAGRPATVRPDAPAGAAAATTGRGARRRRRWARLAGAGGAGRGVAGRRGGSASASTSWSARPARGRGRRPPAAGARQDAGRRRTGSIASGRDYTSALRLPAGVPCPPRGRRARPGPAERRSRRSRPGRPTAATGERLTVRRPGSTGSPTGPRSPPASTTIAAEHGRGPVTVDAASTTPRFEGAPALVVALRRRRRRALGLGERAGVRGARIRRGHPLPDAGRVRPRSPARPAVHVT